MSEGRDPLSAQARWQSALDTFPEHVRSALEAALRGAGSLSAETARRLAGQVGDTSCDSFMVRLLPLAACLADPVISQYYVGAVARGAADATTGWGNLYLGANLEFAGEALAFVVHAEQAAVNHAWLQGETRLSGLAVSAAPCGYCRQFLHEVSTDEQLAILVASGLGASSSMPRAYDALRLGRLLPQAFGPTDLGRRGGLLDGSPSSGGADLVLADPARERDPFAGLALQAARDSYAPYTGGHAGCVLETEDGSTYPGRYAENAAYNPSFAPLQSAIAFMRARNALVARPPKIVRAALVEARARTSLRRATEAVLGVVADGVRLEYAEAVART